MGLFYLDARMSDIASARVAMFSRKMPRTTEVTVTAPGFLTPRMVMQRCSASMTTMTPFGRSALTIVSAMLVVRRSWTWSFLARTSTTRASLLMPVTRAPSGIYATCALPMNGSRVMLADGLERDVADEDDLVVVLGAKRLDDLGGVYRHAGVEFGAHVRDAARSLPQAGTVGLFADPFEEKLHGPFDFAAIHGRRLLERKFRLFEKPVVPERLLQLRLRFQAASAKAAGAFRPRRAPAAPWRS